MIGFYKIKSDLSRREGREETVIKYRWRSPEAHTVLPSPGSLYLGLNIEFLNTIFFMN